MTSRGQVQVERRAHDEALADGFRPSCAAIALLFVVFAGWHAVEFPTSVAVVMVPLALATAALAAGTYALLTRPLAPGLAHPVAAVLAVAALLNCVVQFALTDDRDLTINALLLIVAVGVCLIDPRWTAGLTCGFAVAWVVTVASYGEGADVPGTVADVLTALIVAAMGNVLRRRTLDRLLQAQARLRELSERCELTGLLNRRGFMDAAQRRLATGAPTTMWFIDVDDLKQVNDRRGHDAGDLLLQRVARALNDVFPDGIVARLSGDEFAAVEGATTPDALTLRRRRLDQQLAAAAAPTKPAVQVSTGTATSGPGQPLSEVLAAADAAMYATKAAKRATRALGSPPASGTIPTPR